MYSIIPDIKIASKGKRFANYLLDLIFIFIIGVLPIFIFLVIAELTEAKVSNSFFESDDDFSSGSEIIDNLIATLFMTLYYFVCEYFFNGKTMGKVITNTKAIGIDGKKLTASAAMLRSLSRIVPFEAFSFLGDDSNGWHDKWTKTVVVIDDLTDYENLN